MANTINNIVNIAKAIAETEKYDLFQKVVMAYEYDGESERDIAAACYAIVRTGVFVLSGSLRWTFKASDSFVEIASALDEYNRGDICKIIRAEVDCDFADDLSINHTFNCHADVLFDKNVTNEWINRRTGNQAEIDFMMHVEAAEKSMNLSDWI